MASFTSMSTDTDLDCKKCGVQPTKLLECPRCKFHFCKKCIRFKALHDGIPVTICEICRYEPRDNTTCGSSKDGRMLRHFSIPSTEYKVIENISPETEKSFSAVDLPSELAALKDPHTEDLLARLAQLREANGNDSSRKELEGSSESFQLNQWMQRAKEAEDNLDKLREETLCSICTSERKEYVLDCGHCFCGTCLTRIRETAETNEAKPKCPNCRKEFSDGQFIRIF